MAEAKSRNNISKHSWLFGLVGLLLGAIIILGIRFFTYQPERVHYHANFAVYTNGQREQFKDNFYYEEEGAACTTEASMTPHDRAHMHDHINDVVHIHDHAVTWGQFFQNLAWDINPLFIKEPHQVLLADDTRKVTFWLNGKEVPNVENQAIGDKDRLLVDYGNTSSDTLKKEFNSVASTAAKEDASTDPASCGGSAPTTIHDRITHLF